MSKRESKTERVRNERGWFLCTERQRTETEKRRTTYLGEGEGAMEGKEEEEEEGRGMSKVMEKGERESEKARRK